MRTTFMPDAIVILGHLTYNDNGMAACRILPPNVYMIPPGVRRSLTYGHTFLQACQVARCLKEQQGIRTPIAVSITMKGRTYRPLSPDPSVAAIGNFGLFSQCAQRNYSQDMWPLTICVNSTYTPSLAINNAHQAVTAFSKVAGFTHVFDNSATLRQKVCEAKGGLTTVEFGLAAFDVNYDHGATACPSRFIRGDYTRTNMMRKLVNYFRDHFMDPSAQAGCTSLT